MARLWTGRRIMVDLLVQVGAGKSMSFSLEAARQRGYRQLRGLRDQLRKQSWIPRPRKIGMAASDRAAI